MSVVIPITTNVDRAFDDYCLKARKAMESMDRDDMVEAGRAWRRWLDLFMTPDQREALKPRAVQCK